MISVHGNTAYFSSLVHLPPKKNKQTRYPTYMTKSTHPLIQKLTQKIYSWDDLCRAPYPPCSCSSSSSQGEVHYNRHASDAWAATCHDDNIDPVDKSPFPHHDDWIVPCPFPHHSTALFPRGSSYPSPSRHYSSCVSLDGVGSSCLDPRYDSMVPSPRIYPFLFSFQKKGKTKDAFIVKIFVNTGT